jgi:hypothetical protein
MEAVSERVVISLRQHPLAAELPGEVISQQYSASGQNTFFTEHNILCQHAMSLSDRALEKVHKSSFTSPHHAFWSQVASFVGIF